MLLADCFTYSKDLHTLTRLARGLSVAGYAVLRFDFTGIGDSGGSFADKTVTGNVADLVAAATLLVQRGFGPCAMVGHSVGGAATLLAAQAAAQGAFDHVAGRITTSARRPTPHLDRDWPWLHELLTAFTRIRALPLLA